MSFMYLEQCLSGLDCTILHANNGKEAIRIFEQNPSIDFILMDINMPIMNGYKSIRLNGLQHASPSVVLSQPH